MAVVYNLLLHNVRFVRYFYASNEWGGGGERRLGLFYCLTLNAIIHFLQLNSIAGHRH
jgi:hypothetical protein